MKKRRRGAAALLSLALAGLMMLGGCGGPKEEAQVREPNLPKNDGEKALITVSLSGAGEVSNYLRLQLMEQVGEIIKKYRADFPNTDVICTDSPLESADIGVLLSKNAQDSGWLMDLSPYEDAWSGEGSIANAADRVMHFRGGESIYAIPCQYDQVMLYCRQDWLDEYNEGRRGNERATVDTWGNLLDVPEKLGEKGRIVIEESAKPYIFDALLWSWVDSRLIDDWSCGYYLKDGSTIFTFENSQNAVNAYKRLIDAQALAKDVPVWEFIKGDACVYIGSGYDAEFITQKGMVGGIEQGEGWKVLGLPQGTMGRVAPLTYWLAWGVNKDSENAEKAAHFLAYLTNADNNTHFFVQEANDGVKPIYREAVDYEPSLLEGTWQGEMELLNISGYKYASAPLIPGEKTGVENPVFMELLPKLESGEISPQEMLGELDREYSRLLKEYKEKNGRLPWEQGDTEGNP